MDILTLMTNNNCDILRNSPSPDYRVPPINLDDLPKFLLGEPRFFMLRRQNGRKLLLITVCRNDSNQSFIFLQQRFRSAAVVMSSSWIGSFSKYQIGHGTRNACSATTAMLNSTRNALYETVNYSARTTSSSE